MRQNIHCLSNTKISVSDIGNENWKTSVSAQKNLIGWVLIICPPIITNHRFLFQSPKQKTSYAAMVSSIFVMCAYRINRDRQPEARSSFNKKILPVPPLHDITCTIYSNKLWQCNTVHFPNYCNTAINFCNLPPAYNVQESYNIPHSR